MTPVKNICIRCGGRKYILVEGAIYQQVRYGGKKVACPECGGNGYVIHYTPGSPVELN